MSELCPLDVRLEFEDRCRPLEMFDEDADDNEEDSFLKLPGGVLKSASSL